MLNDVVFMLLATCSTMNPAPALLVIFYVLCPSTCAAWHNCLCSTVQPSLLYIIVSSLQESFYVCLSREKLYREEVGKAGGKRVYEQIKGLVIIKRLRTPALSHMKRYCCALKSFSSLLEMFLSDSTFCKIKSKKNPKISLFAQKAR